MIYIHYNKTTGEILNAADEKCFRENPVLKKRDPENYKPRTPEEPYILVTREEWHEAMKSRKSRKIVDGKLVVEDLISVSDYDRAMEDHLLATRTARGYTLREPSPTYDNSPNVRWASDAADWKAFFTAVMEYGLAVQNEYAATGKAPSLEEFKAGLPKMKWSIE